MAWSAHTPDFDPDEDDYDSDEYYGSDEELSRSSLYNSLYPVNIVVQDYLNNTSSLRQSAPKIMTSRLLPLASLTHRTTTGHVRWCERDFGLIWRDIRWFFAGYEPIWQFQRQDCVCVARRQNKRKKETKEWKFEAYIRELETITNEQNPRMIGINLLWMKVSSQFLPSANIEMTMMKSIIGSNLLPFNPLWQPTWRITLQAPTRPAFSPTRLFLLTLRMFKTSGALTLQFKLHPHRHEALWF